MKTSQLFHASIGGTVVALAWVATHFSAALSLDAIIAYGSVAAIAALAAIDYRVRPRKLFR